MSPTRTLRACAVGTLALQLFAGSSAAQRSGTDSAARRGGAPADRGALVLDRSRLKPRPVAAELAGLIGEYGDGRDTAIVLEREGRLYLRDRERENPVSGTDFTRDATGRGTSVRALARDFRRLAVGTEAGVTFRITPLRDVESLRRDALAASPPSERGGERRVELVELITLESGIKLDLRYASANNFMGAAMYSSSRAFLQRPAAEALVRAHRALAAYGYGLLVHDAYRPWYVTKMFWDATPTAQREFVANPATGSRHNRGAAVDLTLYDRERGTPVRMPGGYDEFSHRSYAEYPGGTALERWHRDLLRRVMESQGFSVHPAEWWHFDFQSWRDYPLLNVPFEQVREREPAGKRPRVLRPGFANPTASARRAAGQSGGGAGTGRAALRIACVCAWLPPPRAPRA